MTVAAGKQIGGVSVVSFDADATLTTNPFHLAIVGTVKVFIFSVVGARLRCGFAWLQCHYLGSTSTSATAP